MTALRQAAKAASNNPENPNQNVCALRVCEALGVADRVRYLHVISDTLRAARTAFSVRSRFSQLRKSKSVGVARALCAKVHAEEGARYFIAHVDGHVLLLGADGSTLIDTAPRKRDRRKLLGFWAVFTK